MNNKYQLSWNEDYSSENDEIILKIKNAVSKYNENFELEHQCEYKYGLDVCNSMGGIVNTAVVTGNEKNRLNNCSLNAVGLATRQPTHLVEANAMAMLRNRDYFFWSKYVQPVEDQIKYISLYLSILAEERGFTLFNPQGSQWFSLDQDDIISCEAYKEMEEYESGTRFIIGVGQLDELIRDNSHYIYGEKVGDKLIFIDGQTKFIFKHRTDFF